MIFRQFLWTNVRPRGSLSSSLSSQYVPNELDIHDKFRHDDPSGLDYKDVTVRYSADTTTLTLTLTLTTTRRAVWGKVEAVDAAAAAVRAAL
jgi:hypothetical protein